jgi:chromosome segregation ATPase
MSRFADFQMLNVFNDLIARARKLTGIDDDHPPAGPSPQPASPSDGQVAGQPAEALAADAASAVAVGAAEAAGGGATDNVIVVDPDPVAFDAAEPSGGPVETVTPQISSSVVVEDPAAGPEPSGGVPADVETIDDYRRLADPGAVPDTASAVEGDQIQDADDFGRVVSTITDGDERAATEMAATLSPRDAELIRNVVPEDRRAVLDAATGGNDGDSVGADVIEFGPMDTEQMNVPLHIPEDGEEAEGAVDRTTDDASAGSARLTSGSPSAGPSDDVDSDRDVPVDSGAADAATTSPQRWMARPSERQELLGRLDSSGQEYEQLRSEYQRLQDNIDENEAALNDENLSDQEKEAIRIQIQQDRDEAEPIGRHALEIRANHIADLERLLKLIPSSPLKAIDHSEQAALNESIESYREEHEGLRKRHASMSGVISEHTTPEARAMFEQDLADIKAEADAVATAFRSSQNRLNAITARRAAEVRQATGDPSARSELEENAASYEEQFRDLQDEYQFMTRLISIAGNVCWHSLDDNERESVLAKLRTYYTKLESIENTAAELRENYASTRNQLQAAQALPETGDPMSVDSVSSSSSLTAEEAAIENKRQQVQQATEALEALEQQRANAERDVERYEWQINEIAALTAVLDDEDRKMLQSVYPRAKTDTEESSRDSARARLDNDLPAEMLEKQEELELLTAELKALESPGPQSQAALEQTRQRIETRRERADLEQSREEYAQKVEHLKTNYTDETGTIDDLYRDELAEAEDNLRLTQAALDALGSADPESRAIVEQVREELKAIREERELDRRNEKYGRPDADTVEANTPATPEELQEWRRSLNYNIEQHRKDLASLRSQWQSYRNTIANEYQQYTAYSIREAEAEVGIVARRIAALEEDLQWATGQLEALDAGQSLSQADVSAASRTLYARRERRDTELYADMDVQEYQELQQRIAQETRTLERMIEFRKDPYRYHFPTHPDNVTDAQIAERREQIARLEAQADDAAGSYRRRRDALRETVSPEAEAEAREKLESALEAMAGQLQTPLDRTEALQARLKNLRILAWPLLERIEDDPFLTKGVTQQAWAELQESRALRLAAEEEIARLFEEHGDEIAHARRQRDHAQYESLPEARNLASLYETQERLQDAMQYQMTLAGNPDLTEEEAAPYRTRFEEYVQQLSQLRGDIEQAEQGYRQATGQQDLPPRGIPMSPLASFVIGASNYDAARQWQTYNRDSELIETALAQVAGTDNDVDPGLMAQLSEDGQMRLQQARLDQQTWEYFEGLGDSGRLLPPDPQTALVHSGVDPVTGILVSVVNGESVDIATFDSLSEQQRRAIRNDAHALRQIMRTLDAAQADPASADPGIWLLEQRGGGPGTVDPYLLSQLSPAGKTVLLRNLMARRMAERPPWYQAMGGMIRRPGDDARAPGQGRWDQLSSFTWLPQDREMLGDLLKMPRGGDLIRSVRNDLSPEDAAVFHGMIDMLGAEGGALFTANARQVEEATVDMMMHRIPGRYEDNVAAAMVNSPELEQAVRSHLQALSRLEQWYDQAAQALPNASGQLRQTLMTFYDVARTHQLAEMYQALDDAEDAAMKSIHGERWQEVPRFHNDWTGSNVASWDYDGDFSWEQLERIQRDEVIQEDIPLDVLFDAEETDSWISSRIGEPLTLGVARDLLVAAAGDIERAKELAADADIRAFSGSEVDMFELARAEIPAETWDRARQLATAPAGRDHDALMASQEERAAVYDDLKMARVLVGEGNWAELEVCQEALRNGDHEKARILGEAYLAGLEATYESFIRRDHIYYMALDLYEGGEPDLWETQGKIDAGDVINRTEGWELLPFLKGFDDAINMVSIYNAVNRLKADEYQDDPRGYRAEDRRAADVMTLESFLLAAQEIEVRGKTAGARAMEVVNEAIPIVLEMVATLGASGAIKGALQKVAAKLAKRFLSRSVRRWGMREVVTQTGEVVLRKTARRIALEKLASMVGRAAIRTISVDSVTKYMEHRIPDYRLTERGELVIEQAGHSPATAALLVFGDAFCDVAGEDIVAGAEKLGGRLFERMKPGASETFRTILSSLEQHANRSPATRKLFEAFTDPNISAAVRATKWQEFVRSVGEEEASRILQYATGIAHATDRQDRDPLTLLYDTVVLDGQDLGLLTVKHITRTGYDAAASRIDGATGTTEHADGIILQLINRNATARQWTGSRRNPWAQRRSSSTETP